MLMLLVRTRKDPAYLNGLIRSDATKFSGEQVFKRQNNHVLDTKYLQYIKKVLRN